MTTLLEIDRIFVRQRAKLIELSNEFGVFDEQGRQIATFREGGQSAWRKALRLLTKVDSLLTHTYSLHDASGAKVLGLVRPATAWKSRVEVTDATGAPAGRLVQENVFGKVRFRMESPDGQPIGSTRRTGGRGTSRSPTLPGPRSGGSPRSGVASRERCSRPQTTTSSRSPPASRVPSGFWRSHRASGSTPPSSRPRDRPSGSEEQPRHDARSQPLHQAGRIGELLKQVAG